MPPIDDVVRVEAGKLIRFDQVEVRCGDGVVGFSGRATYRVDVVTSPEPGASGGGSCLGVLSSIVAPLAGDELVGPPPRVAWLVEVGERFAVELGYLKLAVRGGASKPLLDRTLDPRHASQVSAER